MFKTPTCRRISNRMVHSSGLQRIPLIKPECALNSSPINKLINKINKSNESKATPNNKSSKANQNDLAKAMQLLPLHSNAVSAKPPLNEATLIIKPQDLLRNLEFLTTDKYKRISPELYELLETDDAEGDGKENKEGVLPSLNIFPYDKPDWAVENPNIYKYLREVMDTDSPLNAIYGIDYENNFDPEELEIFKLFDPTIARDMLRAKELFKLLLSGATLTSDQLQFIAHFLRNLVHAGAAPFDYFMGLVEGAGLNTNKVALYMRSLYKEIRSQLSASELYLLKDKLSNSGLLGPSAVVLENPNYALQNNENSFLMPDDPNYGLHKNEHARLHAHKKAHEDHIPERTALTSHQMYRRRNYSGSLTRPSITKDKNILQANKTMKKHSSSKSSKEYYPPTLKRSSKTFSFVGGFYTPWNVELHFAEKPKFFRFSTAVRRSTFLKTF